MPLKTYRDALREALCEEMVRDERVLIMGQEVGVWGGTYAVTRGLLDEFGGKRVIDTPIAEDAIVGATIGAAMGGLRPIAELMTINFSLVAMDQIVNNMAKIRFMFGGHPFADLRILVRPHSRVDGVDAVDSGGRKRPPENGDTVREPGDVYRARAPLRCQGRGAGGGLYLADGHPRREAHGT